jgi:hypothetical protein
MLDLSPTRAALLAPRRSCGSSLVELVESSRVDEVMSERVNGYKDIILYQWRRNDNISVYEAERRRWLVVAGWPRLFSED